MVHENVVFVGIVHIKIVKKLLFKFLNIVYLLLSTPTVGVSALVDYLEHIDSRSYTLRSFFTRGMRSKFVWVRVKNDFFELQI